MLTALKKKRSDEADTHKDVCLMLEVMAIRQQVLYDERTNNMTGFIEPGDGESSEIEATEALVFMVVGLRGHWKAPIAYYLTRGLTASVQSQFILAVIESLTDIDIRVWIITMDGHPTSVTMCSRLGCNLKLHTADTKRIFQTPPPATPST